jgi:hypothetical protein
MRKHRLLGVVVIAVLVGLGGFTQSPTTVHAVPGAGRAGVQLASADLAAGRLVAARHMTVATDVAYESPGVLPDLVAGRARALVTTPFGPEALAWYVAVSVRDERAEAGAYLTSVAWFQAAAKAGLRAAAGARPAPVVRAPGPAAAGPVVGDPWAGLRRCESGGNYGADTGNGYYGAYQFTLGTWTSLGFRGLPSQASPAQQDQAAQELEARRGWSQWPSCARRLGLL